MTLRMTSTEWLESDETINDNTASHWLKNHDSSLSEFKADCPEWDQTGCEVLEYLGY